MSEFLSLLKDDYKKKNNFEENYTYIYIYIYINIYTYIHKILFKKIY